MSMIKPVKAENIDYKRIANTASGAINNEFINENNILTDYWGDESGEVNFILRDDGTYLIEQDGTVMGFTDKQGYENAVKMKIGPDQKEVMAKNGLNNKENNNKSSSILTETLNNIDNRNEQLKKEHTSTVLSETLNNIDNRNSKTIKEDSHNTETTAIGDLKKEYYDGINKEIVNDKISANEDNIDNISKSIVGTAINIANDVIKENKKEIEKNAAILKENYYKYPDYQERLNRSIEDYNQCDGKIADIDFFDNGSTFRDLGCGVSSIMYIYSMLNNDSDFDPIEFTKDTISQNYFSTSGSDTKTLLNDEENNILKTKWGLEASVVDSNADSIISALKDGKKIIFNVNVNDGFYATSAGHYIVLDHYDKDTNQIFVFDPAARPGFRSTERMGYQDVDFLNEVMFNIPNNPPIAVESSMEKGSAK